MSAIFRLVFGFALALPLAAHAQTQAPCQAIAGQLRTTPSPAGGGNLWVALLELLVKQPNAVVEFSRHRELSYIVERGLGSLGSIA
jgi:hypothetical protein